MYPVGWPRCHGRGSDGLTPDRCPTCNGHGKVYGYRDHTGALRRVSIAEAMELHRQYNEYFTRAYKRNRQRRLQEAHA